MKLLCATGNNHKFGIGQHTCAKFGIELEQAIFEVDEIQSENAEEVITKKAIAKYELAKQPLLVSDDFWAIPGLKGFPGPYMKSINHWFTPKDFVNLTRKLSDRTIILQQFLAYYDGHETVVFSHDIPGVLLTDPRGNEGPPIMKVVSLEGDGGLSIAEVYDQGKAHATDRINGRKDAWYQFAEWYSAKQN